MVIPTADLNSIIVYPNPTANSLNIAIKEYQGQSAIIEIYNDLGQLVDVKMVERISTESIRFDVSQYQTGSYTASLKIGEMERVVKPFLVNRN